MNFKQHIIFWNIDNFLLTHKYQKSNYELIEWFYEKYGKLSPISVNRAKLHDFIGMTLDFTVKREFKVLIFNCT